MMKMDLLIQVVFVLTFCWKVQGELVGGYKEFTICDHSQDSRLECPGGSIHIHMARLARYDGPNACAHQDIEKWMRCDEGKDLHCRKESKTSILDKCAGAKDCRLTRQDVNIDNQCRSPGFTNSDILYVLYSCGPYDGNHDDDYFCKLETEPQEPSNVRDDSGGSTGGIVGGIIGALVGVALIAVIVVCLIKRRKKSPPADAQPFSSPSPPGGQANPYSTINEGGVNGAVSNFMAKGDDMDVYDNDEKMPPTTKRDDDVHAVQNVYDNNPGMSPTTRGNADVENEYDNVEEPRPVANRPRSPYSMVDLPGKPYAMVGLDQKPNQAPDWMEDVDDLKKHTADDVIMHENDDLYSRGGLGKLLSKIK